MKTYQFTKTGIILVMIAIPFSGLVLGSLAGYLWNL